MSEPKAYRETVFYPVKFDEQRFTLDQLKEMANRASVNLRGWPFIFSSESRTQWTHPLNDGIETKINEPVLGSHGIPYHYWHLKQSGLLYTKESLLNFGPSGTDPENPHVGFANLAFITLEAVQCLTKLYDGLVPGTESIVFQFHLTGIKGWELFIGQLINTIHKGQFIAHDDKITYKKQLPFIEWKAGLIDNALAVCEYVFPRFTWDSPNLTECRRLFEELLAGKMPRIGIM